MFSSIPSLPATPSRLVQIDPCSLLQLEREIIAWLSWFEQAVLAIINDVFRQFIDALNYLYQLIKKVISDLIAALIKWIRSLFGGGGMDFLSELKRQLLCLLSGFQEAVAAGAKITAYESLIESVQKLSPSLIPQAIVGGVQGAAFAGAVAGASEGISRGLNEPLPATTTTPVPTKPSEA